MLDAEGRTNARWCSFADRFNILKKDEDFKFSLNPGDVPDGQGGVLKAANRKTFPALVGTGAAMSVGVIKRTSPFLPLATSVLFPFLLPTPFPLFPFAKTSSG